MERTGCAADKESFISATTNKDVAEVSQVTQEFIAACVVCYLCHVTNKSEDRKRTGGQVSRVLLDHSFCLLFPF